MPDQPIRHIKRRTKYDISKSIYRLQVTLYSRQLAVTVAILFLNVFAVFVTDALNQAQSS